MECPQENGDGAELIVAYAARALDSEDRAEFERHLEFCARCRDVSSAQRALWLALDELPPLRVSSNFDAQLYRRIAEEQQRSWWQRFLPAEWSWRPAIPVAAVSAILIVAFLVKDSASSLALQQQPQPKLQIEQVERALDDMDLLKQADVEVFLEKTAPREQI